MQLITLICAFILLFLFVLAALSAERRLTRLEVSLECDDTRDSALQGIALELEELKKRVDNTEPREEPLTEMDKLRAREAEKRFAEGIASILSYDMQASDGGVRVPGVTREE